MNQSKSIIDILDLHTMQRNTRWSTQSTYLVDKISKAKISNSVSALLDFSPKRVVPGVGFMKSFDKKIQLKCSDIRPIYSDIISKLLRQEDRDVVFEQICAEFPFLDAVANKRNPTQREMVFRIWFRSTDGVAMSRLLYIAANKHTSKSSQLYYRIFGNVDLALIPFQPDFDNDIDIDWYDNSQLEMLSHIPVSCLITISKYLDHGQSLNLKTLNNLLNKKAFESKSIISMGEPYQQNIEDFYHHVKHAPNGNALLHNQTYEYLAHQTRFKKEINDSGVISTSQGGCLGNVIYSTKILNDGNGRQYMGGMSIGLSARLYATKQLKEDTLLLFHVINQGNYVTNWINSLGFGRLKLESMLHMTQTPDYFKNINAACHASLYLYTQLHPLLPYFKAYSVKRSICDTLTKTRHDEFISVEFNRFWTMFLSARTLPGSIYGIKDFYLLNNLLFEALKEYILLYQKTEDQDLFSAYGSFDMHNQYEFFFALSPDLKDKGFKTEYFSPDYAQIITQLEAHHAINPAHLDEIIGFKKFILDRFSAAMNIHVLEYRPLPLRSLVFNFADKKSNAIYPFLELSRDLPNLFGYLFHSILPKINVYTAVTKDLLRDYHAKLRELYTSSYDERNITVPLKANLFETDEAGARELNSTTVHDVVLKHTNTVLHEITAITAPLPVHIGGVSNRVQLRADQCEDIMIDELIKLIDNLQKPIEEWELDKLKQFAVLLTENKYSLIQLEQYGLISILRQITEGGDFLDSMQVDDFIRLKLVILILEVYHLVNVKSYGFACKKLDDFLSNHKLSNHDLIKILLINQKRGGDLYKVSMLYFIAAHYLELEELNNKYLTCIMELSADLMHSSHSKVKTILTKLFIHLTRKNLIAGNGLIIEILQQEQSNDTDYNLDVYYEIANFVRLGWLSFNLNDVHLYTSIFLQALDRGRAIMSVTSSLANLSLLPNLRSAFLKKAVLKTLLLHAFAKNSLMGPAALKMLLNLSYGSQEEKKFLLDATFSFLISAFDHMPKLSHRIFSVLNNLLDVMDSSEINKILNVIKYSVFLNRDVLFSSSSFFTKLQTIKSEKTQFDFGHDQLKISSEHIQLDNIDIALIEFISSSFKFYNFEDMVLRHIVNIILDRINEETSLDLRYVKALERLLEHDGNKDFFLENNGLRAIIHVGSSLKKRALSPQAHHVFAKALLAILSRFSNDKLNNDAVWFMSVSDFYEALFQEPDLIVELTSFILKFEWGGNLIAEKLAAVELNSESQISIITGLAEIEITSEICNHILSSTLGNELLSLLKLHESYHDALNRAIGQAIINFTSRKSIREQWVLKEFKNTLELLSFSEEDDPDFYADWAQMMFHLDQDPKSFPDVFSLEPTARIEQINASSYAFNELPLASRIAIVDEVTSLLDSPDPHLAKLAAISLEKLCRNKHYSNLLSNSFRINNLKETLKQSSENATKVAILDALFWLTVNNHRHTEMIINTITLPLLLSNLVSSNTDDEVIRATLGLLVNAEFTNHTSQTLLPYLDLFLHFLKSNTLKVVINSLELLVDLSSDGSAFVALDDDNKLELYKQLYWLQRKHSANDNIQELINSLLNAPFIFSDHIRTQMGLLQNHLQTRGNLIYLSELNNSQYDLSQLTQRIFTQYYLKPFAPKPGIKQVERDPNYFEITDARIPRCTHGAMHASRVTAYVKVIHLFRQNHADASISGLAELMRGYNLTIRQVIHLTQIAALFHDVSREDEGIDHWDEASADECLRFLKKEIDALPHDIAQIIANTISFKDNKEGFLNAAISLGLTSKQAAVFDYLRQLVHDADCLDVMRVRKTFKLQFLDMVNAPNLKHVTVQIIALAQEIRALINHQGDQFFDCIIKLETDVIDSEKSNFNATLKCKYEWADNVYNTINHDMKGYPHLSTIDNSIQNEMSESQREQRRFLSSVESCFFNSKPLITNPFDQSDAVAPVVANNR